MNKTLKLFLQFFSGIFVFVFLVGQVWAITIDFSPSSSSILLNESIDIGIVISGLDPENLAEFDFNVNYDPAILSFNGYILGNGLGDTALGEADDLSWGDDGTGTINLAEWSWIDPDFDIVYGNTFFVNQASSLTLATLSFKGSAVGASSLSITPFVFGNELGDPLLVSLGTGSIDVSAPVPEPATIILLGIGLVGLAGIRRRKIN